MKNSDNLNITFHQHIGHFLLLNSEVVDTLGMADKMSLIYYCFSYGSRYEKQHYVEFAFEILQENLSQISNDIKRSPSEAIEIGYSLMRFLENDFFESDEIDEILMPFDTIAIHNVERLSRGRFSANNIQELLMMASYLLERVKHLDEKAEHYPSIREHLLITFFELNHHTDVCNGNNMVWISWMKLLFQKGIKNKETAHLAQKGLQKLNNNKIISDDKMVLEQYTLAKTNGDLDLALLISLCFSEGANHITENRYVLRESIEIRIAQNMEQLYQNVAATSSLSMRRIIVYAIALLQWPVPKDLAFLTTATGRLIQE
ncbi:hypothetical protein HCG49_00050 [Arenibacter sp. 6A1]|uniref:hypothetical protein n=1 Tax=Arenibacter sp. 6A1 TaxID=2720391 RepID=UPI0016AF11BA|nr:hypothetical protein [Arenibacter sp. 6A1]NKI24946.1 hypothetical protein [Arenibacter sp. 6A1]